VVSESERARELLSRRIRVLAARAEAGLTIREADVVAAIDGSDSEYARLVQRVWDFIGTLGAPPRALFEALLTALDDDAQRARTISQATIGPALATRIILGLPALSLLILTALGFNVLGALLTTGAGWISMVFAGVMIAVGFVWSRRLLRRARVARIVPGLGTQLLAIGISSGVGTDRVIEVMQNSGLAYGADIVGECIRARLSVQHASDSGVPVARLLTSMAHSERERENSLVAHRLLALGEHIVLPLGICILPAFIALVAVPAVVSTLSTTGGFSA